MTEDVKVRLVRCPKCDNMLPEHPAYSVYECGGCGTILRAKTNMPVADGLSEKSDEEFRVERKIERILDIDAVPVSVDSIAEFEGGYGIDQDDMELEARVTVDNNPVASSSLRISNREAITVITDRNKEQEVIDMHLKQSRHEDDEVKHAIVNLVNRDVEDVIVPKKNAFVRSYTDMCNVFINGNPISPLEVEKAEMLAGTIQPGDYWYDFRAGFWGVMGQPCNGIIPPFIQEFDWPMTKNCGAGNTGICVNGRELHQKDLNLLASRGLPITSNKSYIIDISGNVIDESSGKELVSLGKLAPILERTRKGFGMKVPEGGPAARPPYFNDSVAEIVSGDGIDQDPMEPEARAMVDTDRRKERDMIDMQLKQSRDKDSKDDHSWDRYLHLRGTYKPLRPQEDFEVMLDNPVASSSPRIRSREAMVDTDRRKERDMIDTQLKQSRDKDSEDDYRFNRSSKQPVARSVHGDEEKKKGTDWPLRPKDTNYQREVHTDGRNGQFSNSRLLGDQQGRVSSSSYLDEEQMRYQAPHVNNYQDHMEGSERVENLEHDRAELRRQLNELEDQLRRSSGVRDAPTESRRRVPSETYGGYDTYMNPSRAVLQNRAPARPPYLNDGHVHVPSVSRHDGGLGHAPLVNRQDRDMRYGYSPPRNVPNSTPFPPSLPDYNIPAHARSLPHYNGPAHAPPVNRRGSSDGHVSSVNRDMRYLESPPRNVSNSNPRYESSMQPELPRRRPPPQLSPFQHQSVSFDNSNAGRYSGSSQDSFDPYPRETSLHHPTCSCVDCSYRNRQVPSRPTSSVDRHTRFQENSSFPSAHHHDVNPVNRGPRYDPRELPFEYPQHRRANPSDLDSEMGDTRPYRPRPVVMSLGKRRLCQPLAGGAPFITCHNCSELLKVPGKFMLMEKHKRKLRCGGCATLILFEPDNKKLIAFKPTHTEEALKEALTPRNYEIPDEVFNNNLKESSRPDSAYTIQSTNTEKTNQQTNERRLNTNGFEIREQQEGPDSVYTVQATDTETYPQPSKQGPEIRKQQEHHHHHSSSVSSEGKESPDNVNNESTAAGPSVTTASSDGGYIRPHYARRYGMGSMSNNMNQESDFRNNSMSGMSAVEERNIVSFKDNSGASSDQESTEFNHLPKPKKANRSFFGSIKKISFRNSDSSRSSSQPVDNVRSNVSINVKPTSPREEERDFDNMMRSSNVSINGKQISPSDVERAEMLAGTIQPGDYWYDYRAGFWGVLGKPCSGIIPPFIQEFDVPMPRKCGAGNTGVCVNGRELHQKDLNLLVSRGLPIISNKSYIIDISGKVMDEISGKELDNLGKLAPTVERTRKGFGMKVPQVSL